MYDELVKRLHRYSENCVAYKLDADFADAVQQAADAIEELQAGEKKFLRNISALEMENENLKRGGRWIPVTERLPDYPGRFICYYEIDDCGEVGHCIDWGRYDPDDGWYVSGVTHWQSLPELPGEERA